MKKTFFVLLFVLLSVCALGQDKQSRGSLDDLNVDFMMRGYFCAGSKIEDKQALGGFGTSQNFPKTIDRNVGPILNDISLIARPDEMTIFAGKYKGLKVLLVNGTNKRVGFPASDSRLSIVQEALDERGKWKPSSTSLGVGVVIATILCSLGPMSIGSLLLRVTRADSKQSCGSVWIG